MIKISVIKKYLFVGLFFAGLGITQQAYTKTWTEWFNNPLAIPKTIESTIAQQSARMLAVAAGGAIIAGLSIHEAVKGFFSEDKKQKRERVDADKQAKNRKRETERTKKKSLLPKISRYTLALLGQIGFGLVCIAWPSEIADVIGLVLDKQQPAPSPQK